jgi:transposase
MCALLVCPPDVTVMGVGEWRCWLRIEIATDRPPPSCCELLAHRYGTRQVELVDLPVFGRPTRLVWTKQRWRCPTCRRAWTEQDPAIGSACCGLTMSRGS